MRILILGDSTSFSGGFESRDYVSVLAAMPVWPADTEIENPSVAGMTTADAARYYFKSHRRRGKADIVVINLGSCDSCATYFPKGRMSKPRSLRLDILGTPKGAAKRPRNLFRPFDFDPNFDAALERPEFPEDYHYNLNRIIRHCAGQGTRVVVIAPKPNRAFAAGAGKGNFIFYRAFGLGEQVARHGQNLPAPLASALGAEETGDDTTAEAEYSALAEADAKGGEITDIATNNLAVLVARHGRHDEAWKLLDRLAERPGARREIALYNASRTRRAAGQAVDADRLALDAFEADQSLYRFRSPYHDALLEAQRQNPDVVLVDAADLAGDEDIIDHCHLVADAQVRLARHLTEIFAPGGGDGNPAQLNTCPVSPEYGLGNNQTFSEFLYLAGPQQTSSGQLNKTKERVAESARQHPLLRDGADIAANPPRHAGEMGRLPDAYIERLLEPYLARAEENGSMSMFGDGFSLPPLAARRTGIDWQARDQAVAESAVGINFTAERIPAIKQVIKQDLVDHLAGGPDMDLRYRTTMYWYLRESIRFGGHSRPSMLYDRKKLEQLGEAILGLGSLAKAAGQDESTWCKRAAGLLSDIAAAHDEACAGWLNNYRAAAPTTDSNYDQRLGTLAQQAATLA